VRNSIKDALLINVFSFDMTGYTRYQEPQCITNIIEHYMTMQHNTMQGVG